MGKRRRLTFGPVILSVNHVEAINKQEYYRPDHPVQIQLPNLLRSRFEIPAPTYGNRRYNRTRQDHAPLLPDRQARSTGARVGDEQREQPL